MEEVAAYSFETQFEEAAAFEKESGNHLFRVSDWNVDSEWVTIPNKLIKNAHSIALGRSTVYAETAALVEASKLIASNLKHYYRKQYVTEDSVHLTANATQAIFAVMYAIKEHIDNPKAIVIGPSYYCIEDAAGLCGIPLVKLWRRSVDRFSLPFSEIESVRHENNFNLIIITEPAYSSGVHLTPEDRLELIEYCSRFGLWLLIDAAFSGLSWTDEDSTWIDDSVFSLLNYSKTIVVDAPTKRLFVNNLKLGLILSPPSITRHLRDFSDWFLGNMTGAQIAFAGLIFSDTFATEILKMCKSNASVSLNNFNALVRRLSNSSRIQLLPPDGGFHAIVFQSHSRSTEIDAMEVCRRWAREGHVLVIPTNDFNFSEDDQFGIRINLMRPVKQLDRFMVILSERGAICA